MRYVQSLPPIVEPAADSDAVTAVARAHATPPVRERTVPPLVYRPRSAHTVLPAINRRLLPHDVQTDRRQFCRRVSNDKVLFELRSGTDRRRRNQRSGDLTTAIDDSV
jgi:hypothetical protein